MKKKTAQFGFAPIIFLVVGGVIVLALIFGVVVFLMSSNSSTSDKTTDTKTSQSSSKPTGSPAAPTAKQKKQVEEAIRNFGKEEGCPSGDRTDCFDENEGDNWRDDGLP